jgi:hypothetical protein
MPAATVAVTPGFKFTIKAGPTTATDVTAQITDLGIDVSSNASTIYTMGGSTGTAANKARVASQVDEAQTLGFIYDGTAFYKTLYDAIKAGTDLTIEIDGGGGKWTGHGLLSGLGVQSAATDDAATCTASFVSDLDFAAIVAP